MSERDSSLTARPCLALPVRGKSEEGTEPREVRGWLCYVLSLALCVFLLCGNVVDSLVLFQELDSQAGDPKELDVIEKDLHRQFPFHEMFVSRGGHGLVVSHNGIIDPHSVTDV